MENQPSIPQPASLWVLKAMLLVLGISALVPGIELIIDPSGKRVRFPEGSLEHSPFTDYLIPGFLLTIFIGLLPLAAWFSLWRMPKSAFLERINPFKRKHWAWTLALLSGFGLMTWILVQMTMVPYFFLQPLLLAWAIAIVLLCLTPGVRAYYETPGLSQ